MSGFCFIFFFFIFIACDHVEDREQLLESFLLFECVSPGKLSQVIRLSQHKAPFSDLPGPLLHYSEADSTTALHASSNMNLFLSVIT